MTADIEAPRDGRATTRVDWLTRQLKVAPDGLRIDGRERSSTASWPQSTWFYETVIQQLRRWTAKAPQLPGGGRTAAEGAGIDAEPPPGDLAEPADEDVVGVAPPEVADVPDVVDDGVAEAPDDQRRTDDDKGGVSGTHLEVGLVSWEAAHERIEHGRDVSSV